jgi:hypothetical protein
LLEVLSEYASSGQLQLVEVPDITVDGAFDDAVKGMRNLISYLQATTDHFKALLQ